MPKRWADFEFKNLKRLGKELLVIIRIRSYEVALVTVNKNENNLGQKILHIL